MSHQQRYRLDDLRRLATALGGALGVPPARASALASELLWYDAAGASTFGIGSLTEWIASIQAGETDPKSEGKITREAPATAVVDGGRGIGPLVLRRAAEIAQEKAREIGVGMVRVVNLGRSGPMGAVAAEIAVGPMVASVTGPGVFAMALPVAESMPLVVDSSLGAVAAGPDWGRFAPMPAEGQPYAGDDWVVSARAVVAFESLASFHERMARRLAELDPNPWEVRPADWQSRRLDHLDHGLSLDESTRSRLSAAGEGFGIPFPEPCP